jgi:hypothetical protein
MVRCTWGVIGSRLVSISGKGRSCCYTIRIVYCAVRSVHYAVRAVQNAVGPHWSGG